MSDVISSIIGGLLLSGLLFIFIGMVIGVAIAANRKSKQYRKYLTDMYVASRIREITKEDGLDINAEEIAFKSWYKKEKIERHGFDLDNSVEEELIEKVNTRKGKKSE